MNKTGWPPGLLQDDDKRLSRWLANRPGARYQLKKNLMDKENKVIRENIIRMAQEAGIDHWWESGNEHREVLQQHLERFAALIVAAEEEKYSEIIDDLVIDQLKTKLK